LLSTSAPEILPLKGMWHLLGPAVEPQIMDKKKPTLKMWAGLDLKESKTR